MRLVGVSEVLRKHGQVHVLRIRESRCRVMQAAAPDNPLWGHADVAYAAVARRDPHLGHIWSEMDEGLKVFMASRAASA